MQHHIYYTLGLKVNFYLLIIWKITKMSWNQLVSKISLVVAV